VELGIDLDFQPQPQETGVRPHWIELRRHVDVDGGRRVRHRRLARPLHGRSDKHMGSGDSSAAFAF
jgi:hypothetical protein